MLSKQPNANTNQWVLRSSNCYCDNFGVQPSSHDRPVLSGRDPNRREFFSVARRDIPSRPPRRCPKRWREFYREFSMIFFRWAVNFFKAQLLVNHWVECTLKNSQVFWQKNHRKFVLGFLVPKQEIHRSQREFFSGEFFSVDFFQRGHTPKPTVNL